MSPDIWLTAVSRFYDLAEEGAVVVASAVWTTADFETYTASGQVKNYIERRPDGSVAELGLSGMLDQFGSGNPAAFHLMELDIKKPVAVPPTNAVLTIIDRVTNRTLASADAQAGALRIPPPVIGSWINAFQLVQQPGGDEQSEAINILLTADAGQTFVSSSVIASVLAGLRGS
jgi:hypothetical protein